MPGRGLGKLAFAVLLGLLMLQIPFVRYYFEPYPMLVLPRGSSIMRVDSTVAYRTYELRVEDVEGRVRPVSVEQVLPALPEQYRGNVLSARFGLQDGNRRTSERDARKMRSWLRARVSEASGVSDPRFLHVRRIQVEEPLRMSGSDAHPDTSLLSEARVTLQP